MYHQILSRYCQGDSSKRQRFKEVLLGILEITIVWQEKVGVVGIADILDVAPHVVDNVVRGILRSLFKFAEGLDNNHFVMLCHKSLRDFLLDAKRSGEFFIPGDQPHGLFYRILSRNPHSANPSRTSFRQHLMGVIESLFTKTLKYRMTLSRIASAMEVDRDVDVVRKVVRGPQRSLFMRVGGQVGPGGGDDHDVYLLLAGAVGARWSQFFLDPNLSGEFYIPSDKPDALFFRILSRPPPSDPKQTYTLQDLLGVLHVLVTMARPLPYISIRKIADIIGIPIETVWNVARGPQRFLFDLQRDADDDKDGRLSFYDDYGFDHTFTGIRPFLRDEKRSGEFYISSEKALLQGRLR